MQDGFLGYRTSFMLDFVVVALVLVVPLVLYSLYTVKVLHNYRRHRNLQILLAAVLLVAVAGFEFDLHFVQKGWENVVAKRLSPLTPEHMARVRWFLRVHLVFAITTPFLWTVTLTLALRHYGSNPVPGIHSRWHKPLGWISTVDLVLTSITGLAFYYVAFVA